VLVIFTKGRGKGRVKMLCHHNERCQRKMEIDGHKRENNFLGRSIKRGLQLLNTLNHAVRMSLLSPSFLIALWPKMLVLPIDYPEKPELRLS